MEKYYVYTLAIIFFALQFFQSLEYSISQIMVQYHVNSERM